jgi:ribose transport system permease protein
LPDSLAEKEPEAREESTGSVRKLLSAFGAGPRTGAQAGDPAGGRFSFGRLTANYGVVGFFLLLVIGFSVALPDRFPTADNLQAILGQEAIPAILALAVILPLAAGEFDLSVAANLGFCSVFAAWLAAQGAPVGVVVVATLAVGLLVGAFNALLVIRIGVNAFIGTLGVATILAGGNLWLTEGAVIFDGISEGYKSIATTRVGGVQIVVLYALVLALVLWYVVERTPYGRYLRATGMGREPARLTGVRTKRYLASAFIAAGALAALAGALQTARSGSAPPSVGPDFLLPAYAAAFLGATTIRPGMFNVWGTIVGVLTLAVGINGLQLAGVAFWVPPVFNGAALIIAVSVAVVVSRRREGAG